MSTLLRLRCSINKTKWRRLRLLNVTPVPEKHNNSTQQRNRTTKYRSIATQQTMTNNRCRLSTILNQDGWHRQSTRWLITVVDYRQSPLTVYTLNDVDSTATQNRMTAACVLHGIYTIRARRRPGPQARTRRHHPHPGGSGVGWPWL